MSSKDVSKLLVLKYLFVYLSVCLFASKIAKLYYILTNFVKFPTTDMY